MSRNDVLLGAFATELRARRVARGFSQEELAHRAGVNRTYVAKLELAKNQPTLSVMYSLAVALDVELSDLIKEVLSRSKRG